MRRHPLLPLLSLAAVTACVAPPHQPPPPPVRPVAIRPAPPPAPAVADWRDWPRTAGDWRYLPDAARPAARYRDPADATLFTMTCDRPSRTLTLTLTGTAGALTIRTTSTMRTLAVRAQPSTDPGSPPTIVATLAAADPLLDAMAFSRGRFTVEQPGRAPLVLPSWAEVGRVIEDCRGPGATTP